jgi:hypothetical protein
MARWKNADDFKSNVKHWADKLDIKVRWLVLRPYEKQVGVMLDERQSKF